MIVLHGLGGSAAMTRHEVLALGDRFDVVTYDARGHGRSVRPAGYTMRDHVTDLWRVAEAWGLERFDLTGYSMGSYTAQEAALEHPERLRRLVLTVTRSRSEISAAGRLRAEEEGTSAAGQVSRCSALCTNGRGL